MEILQGEQFMRYVAGSNIDYDLCDQIVLSIYNSDTGDIALNFVKAFDTDYPNTSTKNALLEKSANEAYKLQIFITEAMTKALTPGVYYIEAKREISGVKQPIIKGILPFFTVKKSKTL